jgi:hypothetical protein
MAVIQKPSRRQQQSDRPSPGQLPVRSFRISDQLLAAIDAWRCSRLDTPTRNSAVRELLMLGLEQVGTGKPRRR